MDAAVEKVRGRKNSEEMAATFTESTTPTAEQAQVLIDQAVRWVVSECGQLPGACR